VFEPDENKVGQEDIEQLLSLKQARECSGGDDEQRFVAEHALANLASPSTRLIVPFCENCNRLLGFNIGVGVGPADRRIRVRPEFAIVVDPGGEGIVWSFGAGVSF
jgi:hypothetical protein